MMKTSDSAPRLLVPFYATGGQFIDLVKALVTVKEHQRKTKSGKVVTVYQHQRNVQTRAERTKMVSELAKKMKGGEHTEEHGSVHAAVAVAKQLSKKTGQAIHVHQNASGRYVTTNKAPATSPKAGHHVIATDGKAMLQHPQHGPVEANPILLGRELHKVGRRTLEKHAKYMAENHGLPEHEALEHLHAEQKKAVQKAIAQGRAVGEHVLKHHPEEREAYQSKQEAREKKAQEAKSAKEQAKQKLIAERQARQQARAEKRKAKAAKPAAPAQDATADRRAKEQSDWAAFIEKTTGEKYKPTTKEEQAAEDRAIAGAEGEMGKKGGDKPLPDVPKKEEKPAAGGEHADLLKRAEASGVRVSVMERKLIERGQPSTIANVRNRIEKAEAKKQEAAKKSEREAGMHGEAERMSDEQLNSEHERQKQLDKDRDGKKSEATKTLEAEKKKRQTEAPKNDDTKADGTSDLARMKQAVADATGGPVPQQIAELLEKAAGGKPHEAIEQMTQLLGHHAHPFNGDKQMAKAARAALGAMKDSEAFKKADEQTGRKPGGQPGNQNAYQGGPKEEPKAEKPKAQPDEPKGEKPAAVAEDKADERKKLKAEVDRARQVFDAHVKASGIKIRDTDSAEYNQASKLQEQLREAERKLYRHDHPEKDKSHLDYKDVGEKIGGARKDTWRQIEDGDASYSTIDWQALEHEPEQAAKVITRSNLLAHSTPDHMKTAGMPANVAYLAHHMLMSIGQKPADDTVLGRKMFAKGIERVQRAFMQATSTQGLADAVRGIRDEARGFHMEPEERAHYDELNADRSAKYKRYREEDAKVNQLYQDWQKASSAVNEVKYNRRLKDEAKRAAQMAPLEKVQQEAREKWSKALEARKPFEEAYDEASSKFSKFYRELEARDRENPESWHNTLKQLGPRFEAMLSGKGAVWEKHAPQAQRLKADDWSWAAKSEEGEGAKREKKAKEGPGHDLPEWERYVPEEVERSGGQQLGQVKPEELKREFGLRAVEYGNYVTQAEAAHHTKRAAEALSDLSDALGLDKQQISYGGRLALAIGARGNGHGLAHYESGKKVINITKNSGGGSVAHEWGHFLDNILSQVGHDNQGGHNSFLSHRKHGPHVPASVASAMDELHKAMHSGDVQKKVTIAPNGKQYRAHSVLDSALAKHNGDAQATMDALVKGMPGHSFGLRDPRMRKDYATYLAAKTGQSVTYAAAGPGQSEFKATAESLGPYWARDHELFARAWEAYVHDKLADKGIRNSYLVSGTTMAEDRPGTKKSSFVYPQGEERQRINAAFDKLMAAVKDTGMLEKALAIAYEDQLGRQVMA